MRPLCPACGEELVYVCLAVKGGELMFRTWQCDCDYDDGEYVPDDLPENILEARYRAGECSLVWSIEPVPVYPMHTYSAS